MRLRSTLAISLAAPVVVALAACGTPPPGSTAAVAAGPVAAITPTPDCTKDGLPPRASIAPAGITTSRGSWPPGSRMSKIKTLKVGVSGDALLWGASDPKNGDLAGFDVDVAKRVADELGVAVEYVVLPLSGRLPALKSGAVDLVAERLSMTCDRWLGSATDSTYINMSSQYYQAGQRLLIRSDATNVGSIEDLKGKPAAERTVCVVTGSTSLTNAQQKNTDEQLGLTFVAAADSGQCLVKFQEGEVAAISADDTTLAGFAAQDPKNARVVGDAFTTETYGLGTSAAYPEFTRFVNAVIQQMRDDGSLQRLYAKWMAPYVDTTAPPVPAALYGRTEAGLKADRQPAS